MWQGLDFLFSITTNVNIGSKTMLKQNSKPLKQGLFHFPASEFVKYVLSSCVFTILRPATLASSTKMISLSREAGEVCRTL